MEPDMTESITNCSASAKENIRRPRLFWAVLILVCMLLAFCLDWPILALAQWLGVRGWPGDFKATMDSLKEFGQPIAMVVACLLIFTMDKPRRSMIPLLVLCTLLTCVPAWGTKLLVHRLRPQAAEQFGALSSLGFYIGDAPKLSPFTTDVLGKEKIKNVRVPRASQRVSFPSAHTVAAFAFAVGLATLYPSGRWIFYALAISCGVHRIVFEEHWFSDVAASVFIGLFLTRALWRWLGRKSASA